MREKGGKLDDDNAEYETDGSYEIVSNGNERLFLSAFFSLFFFFFPRRLFERRYDKKPAVKTPRRDFRIESELEIPILFRDENTFMWISFLPIRTVYEFESRVYKFS